MAYELPVAVRLAANCYRPILSVTIIDASAYWLTGLYHTTTNLTPNLTDHNRPMHDP